VASRPPGELYTVDVSLVHGGIIRNDWLGWAVRHGRRIRLSPGVQTRMSVASWLGGKSCGFSWTWVGWAQDMAWSRDRKGK
jgi:hypothetical protein